MNSVVPGGRVGPFPPLTAELRTASLRATLDRTRPGQAIWLFAYGSLMWRPCFEHAEARPAMLRDYRRRFSIWTAHARGTPERPGLGLALEPGSGHCSGLAFRLAPETMRASLEAVWDREMATGIYSAHWLRLATDDGDVTAICFVADPAHPQYAGDFGLDRTAEIIAGASGKLGTCADYLAETVAALTEAGIEDAELGVLLSLVNRRLSRDAK